MTTSAGARVMRAASSRIHGTEIQMDTPNQTVAPTRAATNLRTTLT